MMVDANRIPDGSWIHSGQMPLPIIRTKFPAGTRNILLTFWLSLMVAVSVLALDTKLLRGRHSMDSFRRYVSQIENTGTVYCSWKKRLAFLPKKFPELLHLCAVVWKRAWRIGEYTSTFQMLFVRRNVGCVFLKTQDAFAATIYGALSSTSFFLSKRRLLRSCFQCHSCR